MLLPPARSLAPVEGFELPRGREARGLGDKRSVLLVWMADDGANSKRVGDGVEGFARLCAQALVFVLLARGGRLRETDPVIGSRLVLVRKLIKGVIGHEIARV